MQFSRRAGFGLLATDRLVQSAVRGLAALLLVLTWSVAVPAQRSDSGRRHPKAIPPAEFSRIVQEFSESGGYFFSDNFTSNEMSYLQIVDRLQELGVSNGAYIGVGPEQNFTYIAKIRPEIAFIVDIRRQAIIQHLLYKAIFQLSRNRAEFLSLLVSRPLAEPAAAASKRSLDGLLHELDQVPISAAMFNRNLARIEETIEQRFQFHLSEEDRESLNHVYSAFWRDGVNISFGPSAEDSEDWFDGFPRLRDLLLAREPSGKLGNFLAREEDYQFVRELQRKNRVIPVVGDFGGAKALAAIADYLRTNGYSVSAFYTSNVEQFLFDDGVFGAFVDNVRKLPVSQQSVIVRAARINSLPYRLQIPGIRHRLVTLLEKIPVFLEGYAAGRYPAYWSLVTSHSSGLVVSEAPATASGP